VKPSTLQILPTVYTSNFYTNIMFCHFQHTKDIKCFKIYCYTKLHISAAVTLTQTSRCKLHMVTILLVYMYTKIILTKEAYFQHTMFLH